MRYQRLLITPRLLLAVCFFFTPLRAQREEEKGNERPTPVYIVCPYHQDSLRAAYDRGLLPNSPNALLSNRIDSLRNEALVGSQRAERRSMQYNRWLIVLLGGSVLLNLISFNSARRARIEIAQTELASVDPTAAAAVTLGTPRLQKVSLPTPHKPRRTPRPPHGRKRSR